MLREWVITPHYHHHHHLSCLLACLLACLLDYPFVPSTVLYVSPCCLLTCPLHLTLFEIRFDDSGTYIHNVLSTRRASPHGFASFPIGRATNHDCHLTTSPFPNDVPVSSSSCDERVGSVHMPARLGCRVTWLVFSFSLLPSDPVCALDWKIRDTPCRK